MGHHGEVLEGRGGTLELILEELQLKVKIDLHLTEVKIES